MTLKSPPEMCEQYLFEHSFVSVSYCSSPGAFRHLHNDKLNRALFKTSTLSTGRVAYLQYTDTCTHMYVLSHKEVTQVFYVLAHVIIRVCVVF